MIRAHQPGSQPIDIPEVIPNPAVVPKQEPAPKEPAPKEPVRVPEKVPADRCVIKIASGVEHQNEISGKAMMTAGEFTITPRYQRRAQPPQNGSLAIQWQPRGTPRLTTTSKPTDEQCFHHWAPSNPAPRH
jgi:hypothetical protein